MNIKKAIENVECLRECLYELQDNKEDEELNSEVEWFLNLLNNFIKED